MLVSAHRTQRPWQGKVEAAPGAGLPAYDPGCYLCPGNVRASGDRNPHYQGTFVFTNDFPALLDAEVTGHEGGPFDRIDRVAGTSRVLCFSPRHDLTPATMGTDGLRAVVDLWVDQTTDLEATYRWVQVFENRGDAMGASNPHPHGQIWASSSVPSVPQREWNCQLGWMQTNKEPLLSSYLAHELATEDRIVASAGSWTALVPFWAVWPFEVMVLPSQPCTRMADLEESARDDLAALLDRLLGAYDRLFDTPFPYSMGWHGAPADGVAHPEWVLHGHFYPPLLRSATVRKFLVGYEMLGEPQRDLTPEAAASRLRKLVSQPASSENA